MICALACAAPRGARADEPSLAYAAPASTAQESSRSDALVIGGTVAVLCSLPPLITAAWLGARSDEIVTGENVFGPYTKPAVAPWQIAAFLAPGLLSLGAGATLLLVGTATRPAAPGKTGSPGPGAHLVIGASSASLVGTF